MWAHDSKCGQGGLRWWIEINITIDISIELDVHREIIGQMGHVGPWLKVWSRGATLTTWWRTRATHARESSEQGSIMLKNYKQRRRHHLEAKRQKPKAKARSKALILSRWWIEINITIDISIELDVHKEIIGQMGHVGPWLKVWSRGHTLVWGLSGPGADDF